ncbi:hypothetical protein ACIRBX_37335 [Kitasatospora sp. NPDC096147]
MPAQTRLAGPGAVAGRTAAAGAADTFVPGLGVPAAGGVEVGRSGGPRP